MLENGCVKFINMNWGLQHELSMREVWGQGLWKRVVRVRILEVLSHGDFLGSAIPWLE